MAHEKNHDYHILNPSIWPLAGAFGAFVMLAGGVFYMNDHTFPWVFLIGLVMVLYVMFAWWSEVVDEAHVGDHTPVVVIGLRYGVIMFIMSEVMFFVAWFWSFFKHALYPMGPMSPIVDGVWPPQGIETFDPWHLPLINTLILLCSGCLATWAHHAIAHENDRDGLKKGLWGAVLLGILFTIFQAYEYSHAAFGFSGNIYGANFFMATGFHGFHVVIGTIFLAVCLVRAYKGHFTPERHVGFEAAAWYWHFVDVVWLFLFAAIYIWGQ
ncbi:cytochrome c oxidase subunit 3 [Neptunicoccus cionae]|uniref:cytochrome c oxidase subunit 3 n=1 Tax=Neptunicoccus cionae TaxID=2035344 RepID=UPI000C75C695|nr:cytochrome c oxidase subunit 3 [Amylibacter cionae]PLS23515.1 cytochrome c oxidase subunit 3 [Amylibacter cionae]